MAIWRDGLLVADTDNHRILQLSPRSGGGWRLRAFAGTGNKGFEGATAFVASFRYRGPSRCAQGAEVLVADSGNHAIRRVVAGPMTDSKGVEGLDWGEHAVVETLAGNGLPGIEDSRTRQEKPKASVLLTYQLAAQFALPYGVACAADGGALVSDTGNHRVRRVRTDGVTVTLAGTEDVGMLDGAGSRTIQRAAWPRAEGGWVDLASRERQSRRPSYLRLLRDPVLRGVPHRPRAARRRRRARHRRCRDRSSQQTTTCPHRMQIKRKRRILSAEVSNRVEAVHFGTPAAKRILGAP